MCRLVRLLLVTEDTPIMNRRQLIQTSGATLAVVIAGCIGDEDESGDSGDSSPTDTGDNDEDNSPEAAVREFYEAANEDDQEAATTLLHEENNLLWDIEMIEQFEIEIQNIEIGTLSDAIEEHPHYSNNNEIQEEEESMSERLDEIGANAHETVHMSYISSDGPEEQYWVVVPNNGGWLLFWQYHVTM